MLMKIMQKFRIYCAYVLFLLAGLLIGYGVPFIQSKLVVRTDSLEKRLKGVKFTSPLLECEPNSSSSLARILTIKKAVQQIVDEQQQKSKIQRVGIYFRDMNYGPRFGIHEDMRFAPASMLKVPILMYYLKAAETDTLILKKTYTADVFNEGMSPNFVPSRSVRENKIYTVEELLNYMIRYSDNNAKNTLYENIDYNKYTTMFKDIGIDKLSDTEEVNFMSVEEYASFYRILYNASYLNKYSSEKALSILSKTNFTSGIVAPIPKSVSVAHKFGERKYTDLYGNVITQLHDCGIVYYPNRPYLVCVMTQGTHFPSLEKTIQKISAAIYEGMSEFN